MNDEESTDPRVSKKLARASNEQVIAEFRANKGRVGGRFKPRVIRERTAEWEQLHARLAEYWPAFLKYEENTDRVFPLVRLERTGQVAE